jgi:enterochelin esterase-like enzyme
VWLPSAPPRAVLFLFDGQNAFSSSARATWRADEAAERLISAGRIVPLAIVGIDTTGAARARDLLPYPDPRNERAKEFAADRTAAFVVESLLPRMARLEPDLAAVRSVGIGGSSYGAIASLHTVIRHPGVFDRLLVESPPLWVGEGRLIEDVDRARALPRRIHVGVGTREASRPETSAELVRLARRLARGLRGRSEVRTRISVGGRHDETAWASRLPDALKWLFSEQAP